MEAISPGRRRLIPYGALLVVGFVPQGLAVQDVRRSPARGSSQGHPRIEAAVPTILYLCFDARVDARLRFFSHMLSFPTTLASVGFDTTVQYHA